MRKKFSLKSQHRRFKRHLKNPPPSRLFNLKNPSKTLQLTLVIVTRTLNKLQKKKMIIRETSTILKEAIIEKMIINLEMTIKTKRIIKIIKTEMTTKEEMIISNGMIIERMIITEETAINHIKREKTTIMSEEEE